MIKFLILCTLVLNGCANFAQKKQNGLIIDPSFDNELFKDYPFNYVETNDSIYVDSVLVSARTNEKEISFSALILDSNNKHHSFNWCKSFFLKDTLIIEFMSKSILSGDKLKIKIAGTHLFGSLYLGDTRVEYQGVPILLILKESIRKSGQRLFGKLKINFSNKSQGIVFIFEGPFTCVIDNN